MDEILKLFTTEAMVKAVSQVKTAPTFVVDRYFAKQTPSLSDSARVYVKKGAGVILASVSPNGEHLLNENEEAYVIDVPIPRFPLKDTINASDLNALRSLSSSKSQTESLSQKIMSVLESEKNSQVTTLEYMAIGALFGQITDGKGEILFDFANTNAPITLTDSKTIIEAISAIEVALIDEFGFNPGFEVLASYGFLTKLADKATKAGLFKTGEAEWKEVDGRRALNIYGVNFIAYQAKYKTISGVNKDFIKDGEAKVIPLNSKDMFEIFYARANHTEAIGSAPVMFFSASPEKLSNGAGYAIISEMKAIPICTRPAALFVLKF